MLNTHPLKAFKPAEGEYFMKIVGEFAPKLILIFFSAVTENR